MNILLFMIPVTLFISLTFVGLFLWANSQGQFDDLETPKFKIFKNNTITQKGVQKNGTKES